MELWIRTQNKNELLKVEDLCVEYNGALDPELHPYRIIAKVDDKEIKLGIYEDKERAMEILDEIQKIIKPQLLFKEGKIIGSYQDKVIREPAGCEIKELSAYVYEMPKE